LNTDLDVLAKHFTEEHFTEEEDGANGGASGRQVRRGDGWHNRDATSAVGQWTS
jgi:hypothetical protein